MINNNKSYVIQHKLSQDNLIQYWVFCCFIHEISFRIRLLLGFLGLSLADDILEASDIVLLRLDHLFSAGDLLLNLLNLLLELGVLLDVDAALGIFLLLFAVFDDGLFFELADMTGHALEVLLELGDLRVSLK